MKNYSISSIPFRILGRNVQNANKKLPLALFWGASAFEINVKANEVWVKFSADYDYAEPWVAIEVNGFQTSRFLISKGEPYWVCVAKGLNSQKENLITILKDTQPMPDDKKHSLFIHEVGLNEEGKFCQIVSRSKKIEFIGDSITSGEGLAGNIDEMEWIPQWFCASKTYALQTAHLLNADWNMISQCGWGLCWGWNGDRNCEIPSNYEKVCSVMKGEYQNKLGSDEKFEFEEDYDYVVLNLGTNDENAFNQNPWKDENGVEHKLEISKDCQFITKKAYEFLKTIRNHNPKAVILWTWGMIRLKFVPEYIQKGIDMYKNETGDKNIYSLQLDAMEDEEVYPEDKGSRNHPGPKTHKLAAKKIAKFLSSI